MGERRYRLSTVLTVLTVAMTSLALAVLVFLLVMTQYTSRVSAALAASVENMRAVEETQIALLLHDRANQPEEVRQAELEMLQNLAAIRRTTSEDGDAVARAESLVSAYVYSERATRQQQLPELSDEFKAAFSMLDAISDRNIADARAARDAAARWDRRLNIIGILTLIVVLTSTAWLLWWVRTQAFQPVFDLARAMERFGRGELDARAEERGPTELRDMIERFNHMAAALAAQRQAQIAFLAGVAHDLRNPLSALGMSVALIDPAQPLPPEPRIRRTIELVRRQLKKLERMVSDLMDMTKVEAGQLELQVERQDLTQLVRDVVSLFEATEPEQRIELSLPREHIAIDCDALRIEQVLSNLISNALKYSPSARSIEVSLRRAGGEAVIAVRDHGVGISEEDQPHVFEPFRRVGVSKHKIPGAGVGLYVVQRLVTAHGGRIELSSKPGEGAQFTVHLPLPAASGVVLGSPRASAERDAEAAT